MNRPLTENNELTRKSLFFKKKVSCGTQKPHKLFSEIDLNSLGCHVPWFGSNWVQFANGEALGTNGAGLGERRGNVRRGKRIFLRRCS